MNIAMNATVGDVAAAEPKAMDLFEELGIDYCCGGKQDLRSVLTAKETTLEEFTAELVRLNAQAADRQRQNYLEMDPDTLAKYIDETHHEYLRKALPETGELFVKVLRAHGANHPELFEVYKTYGVFRTDLEQHLVKEETMLFPRVGDLDREPVAALVRELITEHEQAGKLLDEMKAATSDYTLPADACMSYRKLFASMRQIEADTHVHIHLENNVLFRRLA